jgi:dTDP-4-amino-4,6-dideoxygalactose transaminase
MNIPLVDLKAQYDAIKDELDQAIQAVILDSAFISGKYVRAFEQHFAEYLGVKHAIGVGNGTDALTIALQASGVGAGDEVITAANTFIATSEAITRTGAKVVFVDCCPDTYLIEVAQIERALTERTKAIVPVHLYGQPAAMTPILHLAQKHGLIVVEDAAQSHGAQDHGQMTGTLGDCGCFSFYPGKNLGAYGDAGMVVTNDDELARTMRMYANHGRVEKYDHEFEGINSRMDGIQGAVLDVKLKYLDQWNDRRRAIAKMYDEGLPDDVVTPVVLPGVKHVYHVYVVRVNRREQVRNALKEHGIATGIHYPIPLPFLQAYAYLGHTREDFPVAAAYQDELLSLPVYGDMSDQQVEYVIEQVKLATRE